MLDKAPKDLISTVRGRWPDLDRIFLETPEGRRITYGNLIEESGRIASALVSLGVKPGDRVAAQVEKSPEAILLYVAVLRAGAVYLPLNTAYTLAELEYFFTDAEPTVVVCRPDKADAIAPLIAKLGVKACVTLGTSGDGTLMERAVKKKPAFADVPCSAEDLAAILYTSGTTGRSKGAMLTHGNLTANAQALACFWRFTSDDVLLHALPIFHTHGLFVAINVTLMACSSILFLPKFDCDEVFRLLPRATVMMGVPTFYVRLLEDKRLSRKTTKHMRVFIAGSAPLLAETHKSFLKRTGQSILERYGMTETGMNTSNPYDGARVAGTVGVPLPSVEVRVTEPESGRPLEQGEIGMIEVKGPNVFKGYWRMPEKTAAEFRADGYFITGDLGKIDDDGYVHIVGRGKDLVISGGFNVYPKEIESEIDALPGVVESAVIGIAHPDLGEGVTAVVVRQPGATIDEAAVIAALKGRLANFKVPKRVMFVDAFPRNTMGKVQKNVLRDTYAGIYG